MYSTIAAVYQLVHLNQFFQLKPIVRWVSGHINIPHRPVNNAYLMTLVDITCCHYLDFTVYNNPW